MSEAILRKLAMEYINDNISIADLAANNGISKKKLVLYFSGRGDYVLPLDLQEKVDLKKQKNWLDGKKTYGNKGHISVNVDDLKKYALVAIQNNLTLRELSDLVNVNYATIYNLFTEENLGSDLYKQIIQLYNENNTGKKK